MKQKYLEILCHHWKTKYQEVKEELEVIYHSRKNWGTLLLICREDFKWPSLFESSYKISEPNYFNFSLFTLAVMESD